MGAPDDVVKNAAYKEVALCGYLLTERDPRRDDHDCLLCAVSSLWREKSLHKRSNKLRRVKSSVLE
jgi:hypothetical protein